MHSVLYLHSSIRKGAHDPAFGTGNREKQNAPAMARGSLQPQGSMSLAPRLMQPATKIPAQWRKILLDITNELT